MIHNTLSRIITLQSILLILLGCSIMNTEEIKGGRITGSTVVPNTVSAKVSSEPIAMNTSDTVCLYSINNLQNTLSCVPINEHGYFSFINLDFDTYVIVNNNQESGFIYSYITLTKSSPIETIDSIIYKRVYNLPIDTTSIGTDLYYFNTPIEESNDGSHLYPYIEYTEPSEYSHQQFISVSENDSIIDYTIDVFNSKVFPLSPKTIADPSNQTTQTTQPKGLNVSANTPASNAIFNKYPGYTLIFNEEFTREIPLNTNPSLPAPDSVWTWYSELEVQDIHSFNTSEYISQDEGILHLDWQPITSYSGNNQFGMHTMNPHFNYGIYEFRSRVTTQEKDFFLCFKLLTQNDNNDNLIISMCDIQWEIPGIQIEYRDNYEYPPVGHTEFLSNIDRSYSSRDGTTSNPILDTLDWHEGKSQWYTYSIEVLPDCITWFIGLKEVSSYCPDSIPEELANGTRPLDFIVALLFESCSGTPCDHTPQTKKAEIDYFRYYKWDE